MRIEVGLVCGLSTCNAPLEPGSREVLCPGHLAMIGRPLPEPLEKDEPEENLEGLARAVARDALPLFLLAMEWCAWQGLRTDHEEVAW